MNHIRIQMDENIVGARLLRHCQANNYYLYLKMIFLLALIFYPKMILPYSMTLQIDQIHILIAIWDH